MKVWFVSCIEDGDYDNTYDGFIDSPLYATEELAHQECARVYAEEMIAAVKRYERAVEMYDARIKARAIVEAAGIDWEKHVLPTGYTSFPDFKPPKRQYVRFLEVIEGE